MARVMDDEFVYCADVLWDPVLGWVPQPNDNDYDAEMGNE